MAGSTPGCSTPTTTRDRQAVLVSGHNLNALYQYNSRVQFEEEPDFIDGMTSLYSLDTDHAGCVSEVLQARGPIYTMGAACASGNVALRSAMDEIRHHGAQTAIVVGAVLEFAPIDVHAMALMGAITYESFNDEPARASRPYDTRREGFVPAHGGATLVLEELDAAHAARRTHLRRGARLRGQLRRQPPAAAFGRRSGLRDGARCSRSPASAPPMSTTSTRTRRPRRLAT